MANTRKKILKAWRNLPSNLGKSRIRSSWTNLPANIKPHQGRAESSLKGAAADQKAVNMFMEKIPSNIPPIVRSRARTNIKSMINKGNYKGAREYVNNIQSPLKPLRKSK